MIISFSKNSSLVGPCSFASLCPAHPPCFDRSSNFWGLRRRCYARQAKLRHYPLANQRFLRSVTGATFAPERVLSHGSIFVYMIPPQNAMPARVTPVPLPGRDFSLRYEISQRYHVNAKRPPVSVWNRSAGIDWNGQRMRDVCDFESHVYFISMECTFK